MQDSFGRILHIRLRAFCVFSKYSSHLWRIFCEMHTTLNCRIRHAGLNTFRIFSEFYRRTDGSMIKKQNHATVPFFIQMQIFCKWTEVIQSVALTERLVRTFRRLPSHCLNSCQSHWAVYLVHWKVLKVYFLQGGCSGPGLAAIPHPDNKPVIVLLVRSIHNS
jgi:hypothetical protein